MTQFLKTCSKCRKQKWNSEFSKHKRYSDGLIPYCKECDSKYQQKLRQNNYQHDPKYSRKQNLKSKYKLTIEQYELMLKSQNGVCAICKSPETKKDRKDKIKRLAVDHCHKLFKVRGLLCQDCNHGLGNFRDNLETLKQAIRYLEETK